MQQQYIISYIVLYRINLEEIMKNHQNSHYKDITFKKLGCTEDNFLLNNQNSKISIISANYKTCILSYYIDKDSCGLAINIYGVVFSEIVYFIEKEYRKCTALFTTPFNQCIYMPNPKCKIKSVTVVLQNKYLKKISECNIAAYFTLLFTIKICTPNCQEPVQPCSEDIKDFDCVDTITINSDCFEDIDCCQDFGCNEDTYTQTQSDCARPKMPINYNSNSPTLRNDMYKYLTSFQKNNRL